jgi:GNAT superfamily N-acetyltransferase
MVRDCDKMIEHLDWDTKHFGIRCGRVEGDGQAPEARNFDMVTFIGEFTFSRDMSNNVLRMPSLYKYKIPIKPYGLNIPDDSLIFSHEKDIHGVWDPFVDFTRSRFYLDNRFNRDSVKSMYVNWFNGSISDQEKIVLFTKDYKTCEKNGVVLIKLDEIPIIELVSVAKEYRGLGIGKKILFYALNTLHNLGFSSVIVGTQEGNMAARNLYESMDGELIEIKNYYHWFK